MLNGSESAGANLESCFRFFNYHSYNNGNILKNSKSSGYDPDPFFLANHRIRIHTDPQPCSCVFPGAQKLRWWGGGEGVTGCSRDTL